MRFERFLPILLVLFVVYGTNGETVEVPDDPSENNEKSGTGDKVEKANGQTKKEKKKMINLDSDDIDDLDMPENTSLIFYNYTLSSTTKIYKNSEKDVESVISTYKMKYSFDILHHDKKGKILARYKFLKCLSGDCNFYMPTVYADFIQGGNNLKGIYADLKPGEKLTWNPLLAMIHMTYTPAASGKGDNQVVMTPYGTCETQFARPDDKIYRRRINRCQINGLRNYSIINAFNVHHYSQEIYYRQNFKYNADMLAIEADEKMEIGNPISDQRSIKLHTTAYAEMKDRDRKYMKRMCKFSELAGDCALREFKATYIGKNWKELMEHIQSGKVLSTNRFGEVLAKFVAKKNTKDEEQMALSAEEFDELHRAALLSDYDEMANAIRKPENAIALPVVVNVLATVASDTTHHIAREVIGKEFSNYLPKYIEILGFSSLNHKIIKDLREFLNLFDNHMVTSELWPNEIERNEELRNQIIFTLATLYRRNCETTASMAATCAKGNNKAINDFINYLSNCNTTECHITSLEALANLPLPPTVVYARKFLCTRELEKQKIQRAALRLLSLIPATSIDGQTIRKTLNIFRNMCPLPQSTTDRTLASEILLNAAPDRETLAAFILRSESFNPDNHDVWAFFYDNLKQRRQRDESVDEFWRKMRAFRMFRPNYVYYSLNSSSNVISSKVIDTKQAEVSMLAKTEFDNSLYSRSDFMLDAVFDQNRRNRYPLFGVFSDTMGIADYFTEQDDNNTRDSVAPQARVQLSFLNNRRPPFVLFNGSAQLISAAWNANGDIHNIYDVNIVIRDFLAHIPLLGGLSVTTSVQGVLSLNITGSAEVSLWNRDATTKGSFAVSIYFGSAVSLIKSRRVLGEMTGRFTANGTVNTDIGVEFYEEPYKVCMKVHHGDINIRKAFTYTNSKMKRHHSIRKLRLPGCSFAVHKKATEQCAHMSNE